ncbi:MAG TPA: valine--tRNA ligase [Dictyoglomaceae bacterium]|nr:valine--tRNA ligase [Dictyoglomaceae bacterium]HOL38729.1 valine--tRNA ligase [Dictyoglomaceae bacterium]HPP15522.1 valine--tRNA ligase [Dictyoglomaceae bacterium]
MDREMAPYYSFNDVEKKWYEFWISKDYFHVEVDKNKEPFCMVLPPPNITGSLHLGHALNATIQDILVRWKRMQDYNTLWIPGADHAGIATQMVVERELLKEGKNRWDLGREKFLEKVWEWKEKYGGTIVEQLKRLGVSCDWKRFRFTMDDVYSRAVIKAFVELYKKGYIYRGERIINWCPRCRTAISDLEVKYVEESSFLWHIKYPLYNEKGYIVIATARPETMLGDTAVAVNPSDERYKNLIGKKVLLPLMGRVIPIIADEIVDPNFGTGALKVTPAHDEDDFELGKRHNLEFISVIDENGIMNANAGNYKGLDVFECRKKIEEDLEKGSFLIKKETYIHDLATCDRCGTPIEPMISKQWFMRMDELAKPAIEVVENGTVKFIPDRWKKIYFDWMYDIKDWCLSRQLWWGHRIPAWYCEDCGHINVSETVPEKCEECGSKNLKQDEDVLDTWFSSALWPLTTLGWPENTEDLKYFYPTSVLSTARDIINLWVARMIMMGLMFKKDVPFYNVYVHPTVLTREGKRMSKSKGTGVDPLDLISKYGADVTRFGLAIQCTEIQDLRFHEENFENTKNFTNKIWNASRFVITNLDDKDYSQVDLSKHLLSLSDRWILSRLQKEIEEVTMHLENYQFSDYVKRVYNFFWGEFCDWYIELSKLRLLPQEDPESKLVSQTILWKVLRENLKLLHPVMPFITEEIWQKIPGSDESIMMSLWPEVEKEFIDEKSEKDMEFIMGAIKSVRAIRAEFNIPPSEVIKVDFYTRDREKEVLLQGYSGYFYILAKAELRSASELKDLKNVAHKIIENTSFYVPLRGLIDIEKEKSRIKKELEDLEKAIKKLEERLHNNEFISKAPQDVIEKEKERFISLQEKYKILFERYQVLE